MKTKIVGILVAIVLALAVLPVQAQTYPYSTSYGGIQAHSQMLNSQLSVLRARMALGYVPGGSSITTNRNQALELTAAQLVAQAQEMEAKSDVRTSAVPGTVPVIGYPYGLTKEQIAQRWALHDQIEQIYANYVAKMHAAGKKVTLLKYAMPNKDPILPDAVFLIPTEGLPASAIPASATSAVSATATRQ